MEITKKQFWDNYGEYTLKGLLDSKQLAKDALEIYIKHHKQSIVKIKDAGALIKHHKNGVRWMDEKIEELEAKERSVDSSISKNDLEELKLLMIKSLEGVDYMKCSFSQFMDIMIHRFSTILKAIDRILVKINCELNSHDTPQKTDTAFVFIDPDAPKTVWMAKSANMYHYSPVFSTRAKCNIYCIKRNGFALESEDNFVNPVEVVVDGVGEFGYMIIKGEDDGQK